MASGPACGPGRDDGPGGPGGPGGDPGDPLYDGDGRWRLVPSGPGWMDGEQWQAYQAALADDEEPADPDLEEDPDHSPPPGLDDAQLAALIAGACEVSADEARAAEHAARLGTTGALAAIGAMLGRRGPEMPGSARRVPGECAGPGSGFGSGRELDTAPGSAALALLADEAAGAGDRYARVSDDELVGVICAWDRVEAHASARKHAAVAELLRRRPEPPGRPRLPSERDEFVAAELAAALGVSRRAAEDVLGLAWALDVMLPGTRAAFRAGTLSRYKAALIAAATALLDPAQARAAEMLVLGRAGKLTPGGLAAAIGRAVMEVAPGQARKRREAAAKEARVERWPEASGNASLAGRELPPAQVFAADQRVTWWAEQLKLAGLDGCMDQLRARAFLDILLGMDSRPGRPAAGGTDDSCGGTEDGGRGDTDDGRGGTDDSRNGQDDGRGSTDDAGRGRRSPGPLAPGGPADLIVTIGPIAAGACDHRHQAAGHDPWVMLRHLTQVRHATCTGPACRRPAIRCDFEHNIPYEAGGRTCTCNGDPKCRYDHRLKQDPRWKADMLPDGSVRWTTPAGRQYTTEPTRYPI